MIRRILARFAGTVKPSATNDALALGLQLDDPNAFVRWGIGEDDLVRLVGTERLKRVTDGYYTMSCKSLGGLAHRLGFHFLPREGGRLAYLEFFQPQPQDLARSFDEFQRHLVAAFDEPNSYGQPFVEEPGKRRLPSCRWQIGDVEVLHFVLDRFGPEEHLTIRKISLTS
jgi:hypothetical protein